MLIKKGEGRIRGITLIECLMTILLSGVLLTLGIVGYQHLIISNKTTVYLNELVTTLHYARHEALTRRLPVTVCHSSDSLHCSGAWRDGWLIFINPLNKMQPESGEQILRIYHALPKGDQLSWRSSLNKNDAVRFNAMGSARQAGTFTYCPQGRQRYGGAVVLSLTGRVRIEDALDKKSCD